MEDSSLRPISGYFKVVGPETRYRLAALVENPTTSTWTSSTPAPNRGVSCEAATWAARTIVAKINNPTDAINPTLSRVPEPAPAAGGS
jgi:hypothetical protein